MEPSSDRARLSSDQTDPHRPGARLFVTIGASHYPFDSLVAWVDDWLHTPPGRGVRCLLQHGTSRPPTASVESRPYLGYEEMEATVRQADILVCHGGPGTIMLARRFGRKPIVVPRLESRGECVDDHQVSFARMMATRGDVEIAETKQRLHQLLDAAVDGRLDLTSASPMKGEPAAIRRFEELIEGLLQRPGALHQNGRPKAVPHLGRSKRRPAP